jgi:hypothetical protein
MKFKFLSLPITAILTLLSPVTIVTAEVSNESFIGDTFHGINHHSPSSIANHVGLTNQLIVPDELVVMSELLSLYPGDTSRLEASIRYDDGSLSPLSQSEISWRSASPDLIIQNGFASAKAIDANTRVQIDGSSNGLSAILFIRLKMLDSTANENTVRMEANSGVLSDSINLLQLGWKNSNWFGSYFQNDNNWIYHQHHGWLFSNNNQKSSLWVWSPSEEWLWTTPSIYPHIFRHRDGDWLYFIKQALPRKVYFNQTSKKLEFSE